MEEGGEGKGRGRKKRAGYNEIRLIRQKHKEHIEGEDKNKEYKGKKKNKRITLSWKKYNLDNRNLRIRKEVNRLERKFPWLEMG